MKKISPQKFHELCKQHDWHFEMSDDHKVWDAGRRNKMLLEHLCSGNSDLEHIFSSWYMHKFYNAPKPTVEDLYVER